MADDALAAGDFGDWLTGIGGALRGERSSDVPCGACTACCTASQFIHVAPDETETLARIPRALLFPAPGAPKGHVLMGYDERGHCPMLVENACSIYDHRPRACRTYDCRVFPASGVFPDEPEKAHVAARAKRWRFSYAAESDRVPHEAIRAAATFLREHPEVFPPGSAPNRGTQLAVAAVQRILVADE